MSPRAVEGGLVALLRKRVRFANPPLASKLQREIGCTAAELHRAIASLRMRGMIHFTRLELSASMRDDIDSGVATFAPDAPEPEAPVPSPGPGTGEGAAGDGDPPAAPDAAPVAPAPAPIAEPANAPAPLTLATPDRIRADVAREAAESSARRREAGRLTTAHPLSVERLSMVETVQTLAVETPADLIKALGRTHAQLWQRCIQLGRAGNTTPAAVLYRALAMGLDAIEADSTGETSA